MIFPSVDLSEWLEKYPSLEVLERVCTSCGVVRKADRPFIEKGYAGITAGDCICGKDNHSCMSRVTTNKESFEHWSKILKDFI